jgi:nitrogen fixation NifU-like protein
MDLYREDVMDHYEHPRNQGELTGEDVLQDKESNASCGDMVQFYFRVKDEVITEVKWKGIGCAITTAAASKLSEYLKGKKVSEIKKLSGEEIAKKGIGFEVNPGRIKCLMLPVVIVKKLI